MSVQPADPDELPSGGGFRRETTDAYTRHIRDEADFFAVVLKTHLLVEEALDDCLASFVGQKSARKANLPFAKKVILLEGLTSIRPGESIRKEGREACFAFIRSLNLLRNDLAHNLDSPTFEAKRGLLLSTTAETLLAINPELNSTLVAGLGPTYPDIKLAALLSSWILEQLKLATDLPG